MAESAKVRRKRETGSERINLEDWGGANPLDRLLSFLNIKPEDAPVNQGSAKVLNLINNRRPGTLTDIDLVTNSDSLHADTVPDETKLKNTPSLGLSPLPDTEPTVKNGIVTVTQIVAHFKQASGFGNKRIYRCTLAQDGHSHTEEALYQLLWRTGKPEHDDSRIVIIGYDQTSKRIRLSFNNTKAAGQRLIAKLAVSEVAREISDIRQGKTYRVYSYRTILDRHRQNGLEWVIRKKGVEFVPAP